MTTLDYNFIVPMAVGTAALGYYWYKRKHTFEDIVVPTEGVLKPDMLFGYYGTYGLQAKDTRGYINLLWESQFEGQEKAIQNILDARVFTVLDLGPQCFVKFTESGRNHKLRDNFEQYVYDLFKSLKENNALGYIKALVIMDEPNTNVVSEAEFRVAINTVRNIASKFHELQDVKLAVIYADKPVEYWCIEEFDYVGVDDYDVKSQILVNGTYGGIKSRLKPGAKTILLPGGAFGQDLTPFWNFAHALENSEVGMIVAFTWLDPMSPADKWVGLGNSMNNRKQQYLDAGKMLLSLAEKI